MCFLCAVQTVCREKKGFRYATSVAQVHVNFDSCQVILLQKLHVRAKATLL